MQKLSNYHITYYSVGMLTVKTYTITFAKITFVKTLPFSLKVHIHPRDFVVPFFYIFWHHSIIDKAKVQNC
jgi:hypothetical protein